MSRDKRVHTKDYLYTANWKKTEDTEVLDGKDAEAHN